LKEPPLLTFTDQQRYDQPAAAVLERYTDPEFLMRKYAELGRQDIEVLEQRKTADSSHMRIAYSDAADMDLPDFARRLVPERARVVQTVYWNLNRRSGRITVDAKGSPVTVEGQMQLKDSGGGCTNTINWQVSCAVPLIGGRLEKLLVDGLKKKARRDEEVSRRLLAQERTTKKGNA
jgi:hypothetical protein